MKLTLNEIKAMNEVAGTQLTKEQEIAFIKDRLQELEFGTQKAFDTYKKSHNMRPDTKVKVAGKNTTVAQASKNSGNAKTKGTSVFGGNKKKSDNEFKQDWKLKDVGSDISADIDTKLAHGRELKSRLDKGEDGVYHQKSETGGTIEFKSDGKKYNIVDDGDGIKVDIVPNKQQKQYQKYVDYAFDQMMQTQFGGDTGKSKSTSSQSFTKMNSKQIQKSFEDHIEKNHPKVAEKWGDVNGNIESKSGRYQLTTVQRPNKGLEVVMLDTDRDDDHPKYEKSFGVAASLDKATDLYLSTLKGSEWSKVKNK